MKNIFLFCTAGMSTSLLVTKMRDAAKKNNVDVNIDAFPIAELEKHMDDVAVILLGPQIRYAFKKSKELCDKKNIPISMINPMDYGVMDGDKVLKLALSLINK
jgi:PTS system cellobiose-specific IIB component